MRDSPIIAYTCFQVFSRYASNLRRAIRTNQGQDYAISQWAKYHKPGHYTVAVCSTYALCLYRAIITDRPTNQGQATSASTHRIITLPPADHSLVYTHGISGLVQHYQQATDLLTGLRQELEDTEASPPADAPRTANA